jgi:hypothetical protein
VYFTGNQIRATSHWAKEIILRTSICSQVGNNRLDFPRVTYNSVKAARNVDGKVDLLSAGLLFVQVCGFLDSKWQIEWFIKGCLLTAFNAGQFLNMFSSNSLDFTRKAADKKIVDSEE